MDKGVRKAEAVWKANASSAREAIGLCTIFPSLQQINYKCSKHSEGFAQSAVAKPHVAGMYYSHAHQLRTEWREPQREGEEGFENLRPPTLDSGRVARLERICV